MTFAAAIIATSTLAEQELEVAEEPRALQDRYEIKDISADTIDGSTEIVSEAMADKSIAYWPWPGYRMSYCRMRWNPVNPTTYPYGSFYLYEYGPWAPMRIRGYMRRMPTSGSTHGFSIKQNRFNYRDCASTEPTWDPYNQPYGQMNTWPSQVGDIDPVIHNTSGNAWYYKTAWQPTLYGGYTVNRRSMTIYSDFGSHENHYGCQIACCNIQSYWIMRHYANYKDLEPAREQGVIDDETEIISEEEFKQMFEREFEGEDVTEWDEAKMDEKTAAEDGSKTL